MLADREAKAARAVPVAPPLREAVCQHLTTDSKDRRLDIRVAVAHEYITADSIAGRQKQLEAFRTLIDETCATLRFDRRQAALITSAFVKAAAHRVSPLCHERKEVQMNAGFRRRVAPVSTAEDVDGGGGA